MEGAHDQHIRMSVSEDGGRTWSNAYTVVDGGGQAVWAPVVRSDWDRSAKAERLQVLFAHSHHNCTHPKRPDWLAPGGDIYAILSTDGGR